MLKLCWASYEAFPIVVFFSISIEWHSHRAIQINFIANWREKEREKKPSIPSTVMIIMDSSESTCTITYNSNDYLFYWSTNNPFIYNYPFLFEWQIFAHLTHMNNLRLCKSAQNHLLCSISKENAPSWKRLWITLWKSYFFCWFSTLLLLLL